MAGIVTPTNVILIKGNPNVVEYKTAGSSTIKPGDLVYISATNVVSEGGAPTSSINLGIGIVGYEQSASSIKPATRATAYAADTTCPVILIGSGAIVMAAVTDVTASWALTGQASAGEMVKGIIGTNHIYAICLTTKSGTGLTPVILL